MTSLCDLLCPWGKRTGSGGFGKVCKLRRTLQRPHVFLVPCVMVGEAGGGEAPGEGLGYKALSHQQCRSKHGTRVSYLPLPGLQGPLQSLGQHKRAVFSLSGKDQVEQWKFPSIRQMRFSSAGVTVTDLGKLPPGNSFFPFPKQKATFAHSAQVKLPY